MRRNPLRAIQRLVFHDKCDISSHAALEAAEDDLHAADIQSAILTGKLIRVDTGDRRGRRYIIVGLATDLSTTVGVVVRFKSRHRCVIITTYEVKE